MTALSVEFLQKQLESVRSELDGAISRFEAAKAQIYSCNSVIQMLTHLITEAKTETENRGTEEQNASSI